MNTLLRIYCLLACLVVSILTACTPGAPVPTITPPAPPTAIPVPLSSLVSLTTIYFREEGTAPKYVITAQIPRLAGSEDDRAKEFNEKAEKIIREEIQYFRENIIAHMPAAPVTNGSSFDTQYALVYQTNGLWALKFNFSGYADGAAHPFHYSMTINYDLEHGRELALGDLFAADTGYLKAISSFCIAELTRRNIGFYSGFERGAEPNDDNYRNWNITFDGILITFDEYQVAPYAAGPQTITVPYSELKPIINPQGPLVAVVR